MTAEILLRMMPQLALKMPEQTFDDDSPTRWVTGDAVYGRDGKLRRGFEACEQAYALGDKSPEKPTTFQP